MPFQKILVALDGSRYSQVAAEYGIWLATQLEAELSGQHVVDPRMVDLFVAPEFGEELGFSESIETEEKVFSALRRIGKRVLEVFSKESFGRGMKTHTYLDVGHVIDEILRRSEENELTIVGHRGRGHKEGPTELMTGSVAERVAGESRRSVLIAVSPVEAVKQILVAYDGSEPARGALLAAERLALETGKELAAVTAIASDKEMAEAKLTVEQGESYLREFHDRDIFSIRQGPPARTIMSAAEESGSLLVLGAYGFRTRQETVLGSTTTYVVRRTRTSVLVYR